MSGRNWLQDVAVAAVMIAVVFGLALGASWLVPLDFTPPRQG